MPPKPSPTPTSSPTPPSAQLPSPPVSSASATVPSPQVTRFANPQRGEVYWVNIPKRHTVGHEQYKRRPFLIISNNAIHHLKLVIGVPLSFEVRKKNRQYHIGVLASDVVMDPGSTLQAGERIALAEQARCLALERLEPDRQAKLTDTAVYAVEAGVAFVMDIR
jgi:mRNA-degrading endonuclease toxin of MazEF toxin-antitoxin module